jgi:arylsulfatase A-like enzyme
MDKTRQLYRRIRRPLPSRIRRPRLEVELLEKREVLAVAPGPDQHVLLLSVDGLHQADIADPSLAPYLTNTLQLQNGGINYTNAHTTSPSDSFPGTLSYLTGAHPGTTGVFYDDSYSRTLLAPGSNSNATPGTEVTYFEVIDKNFALISGGGNFDASSIDPSLLPIDPTTNQVVYPNQFLQTNTIFDVAHHAGLYTAFSDKHPAYQIANGPDPRAINDFYGPEINSTTALLDNTTGKTVDVNNLLFGGSKTVTGLTVAQGFTLSSFATNPVGASQPDSIAVDGLNVYVGYGNGVAKDGSDGKSSTIVQYDTAGHIIQMFSVLGHNDGLKVDPATHLLWALQNEDGNPKLVLIDPVTDAAATYSITAVNGGGYDDIAFLNGNVYFSASNPANNPNTDPAVVKVKLNTVTKTATTTPILLGNASALNVVTNIAVTLNLQDPDSMTVDKSGNLVLDSQADNELVTIHNPGTASQSVTVLPLSDAANLLPGAGVDDTLFTPSKNGEILVTDRSGAIYLLRGAGVNPNLVLSAAQDAGELGSLNTTTGMFTPIISGLGSPRGLAFINAGPFADLSNYTLVDPSTDPVGPFDATGMSLDPNLINDTTKNVLLTEKYDDLKVKAILNEIAGLPSHTFFHSNLSQIPAIFGMNFQAVSVAEKDANGGINLLPNGQEGLPNTVLEGAMQHTDDSIGQIVAALKAAGIWDSTLVVLTAKHGQAPRVGLGGLMVGGTLPNLLGSDNINVAQATEDDVSLLWLSNQAQTMDAVTALQNFKATGTIQVTFSGVTQTLPASQIIKQIIADTPNADASLGSYKLGNPATDSTTPDIVVTLQPGYIWVGNVFNKHKRGEHGGFSDDDTHVALILGGGAIGANFQGTTQTSQVETVQIAVTALQALGLNPNDLTGVKKEHTKPLPGTGIRPHGKKFAPIHARLSAHVPGTNPLNQVSGSIVSMINGSQSPVPVGHGGNPPSTIVPPLAAAQGSTAISVSPSAPTGRLAFLGGARHVAVHDAVFGGHHSHAALDAVFAEGI